MNQVTDHISNQPYNNISASIEDINQAFLDDVLYGLSQPQKTLPCKWFYDEAGSALFEKITKTPEYYPTRIEAGLLLTLVSELPKLIQNLTTMIEPGSGASVKTRILLDGLDALKTYVPMDISEIFLNEIAEKLAHDYPRLNVQPMVGDFSNAFDTPDIHKNGAELIFFPGSTIGNFSPDDAQQLLTRFHDLAKGDAWLLIGVDSTQNAQQLLAAYNDASGITAAFNQNVLLRANHELAANFKLADFAHEAILNQSEGRVEMHLRSLKAQSVMIQNTLFSFKKDETIFTESCYKYTHSKFLAMAHAAKWELVKHWQDTTISAFTLFLLKAAK